MADSKDTSSFFQKVVKFVASSTSEWGELNSAPSGVSASESESNFAKSELKAMIERKRHNDFVRKHEFDMLRKVRREGLTGEQKSALEYSSRIDESEDRNEGSTKHHEVKAKIDEIEQQMVVEGLSAVPLRNSGFYTAATQPAKFDTRPPVPTQTVPLVLDTQINVHTVPDPLHRRPTNTTQNPLQDSTPSAHYELIPIHNKLWQTPPPVPLPKSIDLFPDSAGHADLSAPPAKAPTSDMTESMMPSAAKAPAPVVNATSATSTLPSSATQAPISATAATPVAAPAPRPFTIPLAGETPSSYNASLALEINEIAHDHGLDEAVVAFANADFGLCERSLLSLTSPHGQRTQDDETWLTLFDFYRAVGEQAKFENLALDYARQLGLSSPQWFSMPKMVAEAAALEERGKSQPQTPVNLCELGWVCPVRLHQEEVAKLQSLTLQMPLPWVFDWADLSEIEPQACASLSDLFRIWMDQHLDMRWVGGEQLFKILADATTAGSRDVDPIFWKLRFDALRIADRAHQFDEVAIDYCVTYEVSPPSWEPAQCVVHVSNSGQSTSAHPLSAISQISTTFVESRIVEEVSLVEMASLELSGQLVGDINSTLSLLDMQLKSAPIVSVSCRKLIRVDFIAAGDLLNWVMRKRNENRTVIFNDSHRLIALFFGAMGINDHSTVKVLTL